MTMHPDFDIKLPVYLDHIKAQYRKFWSNVSHEDESQLRIREQMAQEFDAKLTVVQGKKFLKVCTNGSVHSFIVLSDDGKFKCGDILKAASWAAPAKNFARGNILTGDFQCVSWTGA